MISFTLGAIAAMILNAPLMTLMFTMVGFKKCTIDISILLIFLTILALTLVAVIMTTVVSIRIRKVDPRELLID